MVLPMNDISETLFFNQRLIISQAIKEPLAWRVTKVEDLNPKGIRRLTFAADKWNQHHDYIEKDEDGNIIGLWADYWTIPVEPKSIEDQDDSLFSSITSKITATGKPNQVKIGGTKTFTVSFYDDDQPVEHEPGEWEFTIDGEEIVDQLVITYPEPYKAKIKVMKDDDLIGKILSIVNKTSDGVVSSMDVALIAL